MTRLVKIYALKNLKANSAKQLLEVLPFDSDQIKIEANAETNSIVALGTQEQHSLIGSLLSEVGQLLTNTYSGPKYAIFGGELVVFAVD